VVAVGSYMRTQRGITLIEVLITLVILAIGLLGLVGLQARIQILQIEAYQRAQALMLLEDMGGRIANNRNNAAAYATGTTGSPTPLGAGMTCPTATTTRRDTDVREWCLALQGASEQLGTTNVGTMVGGRGCVEDLNNGAYLVTVAWQGLAPISASAPPAGVACGLNAYNGALGSACAGDLCRRAVTTVVQIATLASP
jgi:type IV pilus assembly protein PilV